MSYQIITGMWACDIQNSSSLNNSEKNQFNAVISDVCAKLIDEKEISIISDQFRGDGKLLTFDAKNVQMKLFDFALSFCEKINLMKEEGKIDKKFLLRTYITIGTVMCNEEKGEVVGNDVDDFCRLIDNKEPGKFEVPEHASVILICIENGFNFLGNKNEELVEVCIDEKKYYKKEYWPQNIIIRYVTSEQSYNCEYRVMIKEELEKHSLKIINVDTKKNCINIIGNKEHYYNIYKALDSAMGKISNCGATKKWKGIGFVLIDFEINGNIVNESDVKDYFCKQQIEKFSNFMVWSDFALDRFRSIEGFENIKTLLKKNALTENMRIYIRNYSEKIKRDKKIIYFSNILEQSVYLHSFDYGGLRLIEQLAPMTSLELYLRQQLEMGLILCDSVIIHSAEILRTHLVYKVLEEYKEFIVDGSIKVLFSSKVNDIKSDFENYIDEKIIEYNISEYGEIEAASLQEAKQDKQRVAQVIDLLSECPNMIKRDGDGTSNLEELINEDLKPGAKELIFEKNEYTRLFKKKNNYTLLQLLNAKYIENGHVCDILTDEIRQRIIEKIEQLVNGVVSASIINSVFEKNIPKDIQKGSFKFWYYALMHRANYLYAKVNTDKFLYMEYLPMWWKNTLFDYNKFMNAFVEYTHVEPYLGSDDVSRIRKSGDKWKQFRLYYSYACLLSYFMNSSELEGKQLYDLNIVKAKELLKKIFEEGK